jgi:hypothetical protein
MLLKAEDIKEALAVFWELIGDTATLFAGFTLVLVGSGENSLPQVIAGLGLVALAEWHEYRRSRV